MKATVEPVLPPRIARSNSSGYVFLHAWALETFFDVSIQCSKVTIHQFVRPNAHASLVLSVTTRGKTSTSSCSAKLVSNEFRNFKTAFGARVGASVFEYGTFLRDSFVCVRTDGAFNESIETFWSGRLRSCGSCLHSHRQ
jgi:hypothetical protein